MQCKIYKDVHEFYHATYDVLMRHEAQNLVPLGNVIIGHEGKDKSEWRDPANWLMATVSDARGILLSAVMTPPYKITLYATDNIIRPDALGCLIEGIKEWAVPGVMTEKALAEAFYAASEYGKTQMSIPQEAGLYLHKIATGKFFVLEDNGRPVSMAGINKEMQTVVGVGFVYTPPYERGKGYATALVAQISQLALDRGFSKCVLYTDMANPTSNNIYQRIGYRALCDSREMGFGVG